MPDDLSSFLTVIGLLFGLFGTIVGALITTDRLKARRDAAKAEGALEGTQQAVHGAEVAAKNWEQATRAMEANHSRERAAWESERDDLRNQLAQALERIHVLEVEYARISTRPDVDQVAAAVERHNTEAEKRSDAIISALGELTSAIRDSYTREHVTA